MQALTSEKTLLPPGRQIANTVQMYTYCGIAFPQNSNDM